MSTEKKQGDPKLLTELANAVGLSPTAYYDAVKAMCGAETATDADFAALLMVAKRYDLNPIIGQIFLIISKKGRIKVAIPADGYMVFLHRAEKDGVITDYEYEEGWFPDTRTQPDVRLQADGSVKVVYTKLRRGGRVQLTRKDAAKPRVHTEWLDECVGETTPWNKTTSRMLQHRTFQQALRRYLGVYVPDADEAANDGDALPAPAQPPILDGPRTAITLPALTAAPEAHPQPETGLDMHGASERHLAGAVAPQAVELPPVPEASRPASPAPTPQEPPLPAAAPSPAPATPGWGTPRPSRPKSREPNPGEIQMNTRVVDADQPRAGTITFLPPTRACYEVVWDGTTRAEKYNCPPERYLLILTEEPVVAAPPPAPPVKGPEIPPEKPKRSRKKKGVDVQESLPLEAAPAQERAVDLTSVLPPPKEDWSKEDSLALDKEAASGMGLFNDLPQEDQ
jgi:hypothetical protein